MNSVSRTVAVAKAVAWRHLYKWIRIPANFIPTVAFPLVFFAAFAGGLSAVSQVPGFDYEAGYTAFQYVFVLLQSAAFGGIATGFTIGADFDSGFMRRFMLAAPNRAGIYIGYVCSTFVRWVVISSVMTGLALMSGMEVLGSPLQLLALFGLAAMVNVAGMSWAAGVMFRGRTVQVAPGMQVPIMVLLFLTPVYVPLTLLEGWIEHAAGWNPVTPVLETGRRLLAGDDSGVGFAALCALGLAVVLIAWALTGVRRAERAS
jgi:ABC-2 type transport system permease protein